MLKKREVFRACFDGFNFEKIAGYGEADIQRILAADGMIRSPQKVNAIIANAQRFRDIRSEFGSFCDYIWAFSDGKTILYDGHGIGKVPVSNGLSSRISTDLKRRGFKYIGPVTIYSHLQACGIINDHDVDCPRFAQINDALLTVRMNRDEEVY